MGGSLPLDSHLMVGFITSKMHRSSRRCPIALEKATKPILWEGPRTLVTILFPKIHHRLCFITSEMHRSSRQCPIALKKATKPILWEEPRKLVPILFPKYDCFYSFRFLSFGVLHHIENACGSPSIPLNMGKCSKIHHRGRAWDIGTHTFPEVWVVLFYQISIL